jgi:hypothetical protein
VGGGDIRTQRLEIWELHGKLMVTDPDYTILQIKQKYGSLRYYTSYLSEEGTEIVDQYEKDSINW